MQFVDTDLHRDRLVCALTDYADRAAVSGRAVATDLATLHGHLKCRATRNVDRAAVAVGCLVIRNASVQHGHRTADHVDRTAHLCRAFGQRSAVHVGVTARYVHRTAKRGRRIVNGTAAADGEGATIHTNGSTVLGCRALRHRTAAHGHVTTGNVYCTTV